MPELYIIFSCTIIKMLELYYICPKINIIPEFYMIFAGKNVPDFFWLGDVAPCSRSIATYASDKVYAIFAGVRWRVVIK